MRTSGSVTTGPRLPAKVVFDGDPRRIVAFADRVFVRAICRASAAAISASRARMASSTWDCESI